MSVVLLLRDVPKTVFWVNRNGGHKQPLGGHVDREGTCPPVATALISTLSILWPRHGSAFYSLYPILALTFRHNIGLSPSVSIWAHSLLLAFESGFGKLKGRTSKYRAFACAIAWLLIPAFLNLTHLHRPVAITSICQCFHCFHPTPRGGLRLDFVRPKKDSCSLSIVCMFILFMFALLKTCLLNRNLTSNGLKI